MAEIAVLASVIAIIQLTDRIIGRCKFYIETARDASSDLRVILLETSTLKMLFENLKFLATCNSGVSSIVITLSGKDGPIEGCCRSITELEKLFPSDCIQSTGQNRSKRQRVKATLAALAWPLKENKARKLLDEIMRYKATITIALTTESIQDIKNIKTKALDIHDILRDSQRQEVCRWLQHTDPSPLHHRAQKHYEPGTGNWMLRSPDWASWLEAKQRCLWIHGIPGAGKTVLMSHLIEQIKQHCDQSQNVKSALVYYYFYFGHNQDEAAPLLRWLINQLCRQADLVPGNVYKLYKHGGEPSHVELLKALEDILDEFEVAYVVVDAVDESNPREDLLKVLRDLATDSRFKKLQLLASSREYIDIERVMGEFSVSVSMANPFVEEDIKLHVRSTLQSNSKFRRWPQELLDEVEDEVSRGARGMFRWAVCQIDILQRLKCERDVVKKALANLPKTLDETYDRIFLAIPEEEQLFVHHALQWIYYHNVLYDGESIPCAVLLQAVGKSTAGLIANHNERFYDNETIRELCGCLINITTEDYGNGKYHYKTLAVSFAHYTVREYLDSARISKGFPASFPTNKENLQQTFMEITLSEALHVEPNELWVWKRASNDTCDLGDAVYGNFNGYCAASALLSMRMRPREISQQKTLCNLAIDLLDPFKTHFQILQAVAWQIHTSMRYFNNRGTPDMAKSFWSVIWNANPSDANAVRLLNILLLPYFSSDRLAVAKKFLQGIDTKDFLQTRLTFTTMDWYWFSGLGDTNHVFDGSIIDVFAQIASDKKDEFKLLLEYGTGLFDPSRVLLLFIGSHDHNRKEACEEGCLMERLLELRADPNVKGYQVTPLQIAVVSWDFEGVSTLLKAGADPNDTGDSDGIAWRKHTVMSRFNCLHGTSPLYICKEAGYYFEDHRLEEREKDLERIEAILLQYKARYWSECPKRLFDWPSEIE